MKSIKLDRDFEAVILCAIRYCIGRCSYMPSLVQKTIRPYLKDISTNTLTTIARDITEAEHYGWEIDKNDWMIFLSDIKNELENRQ